MKLVSDWRRVVARSFSFWATVAGVVALVAPELRYRLTGVDTDPYMMWLIALGLLLASLVGRLVEQSGRAWVDHIRLWATVALIIAVSAVATRAADVAQAQARYVGQENAAMAQAKYAGQEAAAMAILLPLLEHHEGIRLEAYLDPVGIPTICAGVTKGVTLGMRKTADQCRDLLRLEAARHRNQLAHYYLSTTILQYLPPARDAAFSSLAYNIGVDGCGQSTAMRRLNAGDVPGACDAITWFNKAGRRVMRGLVVRRADERDACMININ